MRRHPAYSSAVHPALDDPAITRGRRTWRQRISLAALVVGVASFLWRSGGTFTTTDTAVASVLALLATLMVVLVIAALVVARAAQRLSAVMDDRELRAPDALRFPTYGFSPTAVRLSRALGLGNPASTFSGWAIVEVSEDGVRVFRRPKDEPVVVIARSVIRDAGTGAIVDSVFRVPSLNLAVTRRGTTTGVPLAVLRTPLNPIDEAGLVATLIEVRGMLRLESETAA